MIEPSQIHPTIYKRTSTGAIQTWWIEQDNDAYRVATGQIDGAITRSAYKQAFGKNQGRANETSPEEQADAEIAAEYRKKLAQGRYSKTVEGIDEATYFPPMLAHPWEKYLPTEEQYAKGLVYSQPKLDGVRCIASSSGLWTRKGKPLIAAPHVWQLIMPVFNEKPDLIIDGELYNHEYKDLLNRISGLCRKTKLTDEEFEQALVLQYHVYDCMGGGDYDDEYPIQPTDGFTQRFDSLNNHPRIGRAFTDSDHLQFVQGTLVVSREHLDDLNAEYLAAGYEGQIIRILGQAYENKRSKYLLKRKEFIDQEFTIIGFTEGVGNRSGMAGNVMYVTDDGKEFGSGIAGGEDFYKHLWANQEKYIGGQGTVRFFKWTEYGIPYLPVTHAVFEGKRDV